MSERDWRTVRNIAILSGLFGASIAVANVLASVKLTAFELLGFTLVMPAGFIAYAITFPITDIVDEVYGKKAAMYIVWGGLAAEIGMLLLLWGGYLLPPLEPQMQEALKPIASMSTRIVVASLLAYLASQTHDVWAFWKWREVTGGRWLWLRNNASTMVSQLIDTVIFIVVAFYGVLPNNVVLSMILAQWLGKVLIAAADTPLVYLGVWLIRRNGGLGESLSLVDRRAEELPID